MQLHRKVVHEGEFDEKEECSVMSVLSDELIINRSFFPSVLFFVLILCVIQYFHKHNELPASFSEKQKNKLNNKRSKYNKSKLFFPTLYCFNVINLVD